MEFTEDQIRRYSRHIILPEVGGMVRPRNRECPVCGDHPTIPGLAGGERSCVTA